MWRLVAYTDRVVPLFRRARSELSGDLGRRGGSFWERPVAAPRTRYAASSRLAGGRAGADGGSGLPPFPLPDGIVPSWRHFSQARGGFGRLPARRGGVLVPVRSSSSRPRADVPVLHEGLDPQLVPLIDHVAIDLAYLFLGVPQPGVPETTLSRPGSSEAP